MGTLKALFAGTALLLASTLAQNPQCFTGSTYCNNGNAIDAAFQSVVAKFRDGIFYDSTGPVPFA